MASNPLKGAQSIDEYAKQASQGLGSQAGHPRGSPERPELLAAHARQRREVERALNKVALIERNRQRASPTKPANRPVATAAPKNADSTDADTSKLGKLENGATRRDRSSLHCTAAFHCNNCRSISSSASPLCSDLTREPVTFGESIYYSFATLSPGLWGANDAGGQCRFASQQPPPSLIPHLPLAEAEEIRLELLNAMDDLDIDGDIAAQQKSRSPSRQVR